MAHGTNLLHILPFLVLFFPFPLSHVLVLPGTTTQTMNTHFLISGSSSWVSNLGQPVLATSVA